VHADEYAIRTDDRIPALPYAGLDRDVDQRGADDGGALGSILYRGSAASCRSRMRPASAS